MPHLLIVGIVFLTFVPFTVGLSAVIFSCLNPFTFPFVSLADEATFSVVCTRCFFFFLGFTSFEYTSARQDCRGSTTKPVNVDVCSSLYNKKKKIGKKTKRSVTQMQRLCFSSPRCPRSHPLPALYSSSSVGPFKSLLLFCIFLVVRSDESVLLPSLIFAREF